MEYCLKLRDRLFEFEIDACKVIRKIVQECGKEGKSLSLIEKVGVINLPRITFRNADGDIDNGYLCEILMEDVELTFVFDDDTYCNAWDILPAELIRIVEEVCPSYGLSPGLIEKDVLS